MADLVQLSMIDKKRLPLIKTLKEIRSKTVFSVSEQNE